MRENIRRGLRIAQIGLLLNAVLALVKLLAGIVGHSYALVADGIESSADVLSSLVVMGGLRIAARSADSEYPFGYGKAEAVAAGVVGLMLFAAAIGIGIQSIREIVTPHHLPAPFTLVVLVAVVLVKEVLFRRVLAESHALGSTAVHADAWHHRTDAITSAAAFIGIAIALLGGPGWEEADDWAALFASAIIAISALRVLRPALADLMDRAPGETVVQRIVAAARGVPGVRATEKMNVRKVGMEYFVDLHVQADPAMPLHDAHALAHAVKAAIRREVPDVQDVLIHMEPYEGETAP